MTTEVNAGLGAPAPKKGMSKGCLVALIVAAVLLGLIVSVIYFVYLKKNQYVDYFLLTQLDSSKKILVESNVSGIDTAYYNSVVDDYKAILLQDTIFTNEIAENNRFVNVANIFTYTQAITNDSKLDSAEAQTLIDTLINQYPDIAPDHDDFEVVDSTQSDY